MSDTFSKVEVITGVARRRRFSTDLKLAVVAETMQPGMSISYVARRHGLSPSLVFRWRRLMSEGGREAVRADDEVVPAAELRRLEERVRDLERLLGRKTMENEILKEALDLARAKKRSCCRTLCRRTVPDEDDHRHAGPCPLEHRRAREGYAAETRAAEP
jgi:transposase